LGKILSDESPYVPSRVYRVSYSVKVYNQKIKVNTLIQEGIIMEDTVLSKWKELKDLVDALEVDIAKSARGVAAAGVRARKGLRLLKAHAGDLVKLTYESDKVKKDGAE
jgi:hypothetical protein